MNADGWTEGEGDLPWLPKPADFDMPRFWDDLMNYPRTSYTPVPPPLRFLCTACDGDGRITHLDAAENRWNMSCPACEGTGSMTIVPERKGTR